MSYHLSEVFILIFPRRVAFAPSTTFAGANRRLPSLIAELGCAAAKRSIVMHCHPQDARYHTALAEYLSKQ
jgi:hypothetical protein